MKRRIWTAAVCVIAISGQASSQPSEQSKDMLATLINLHGELCAQVTRVTALGADRQQVACVRYRNGTGGATYQVNARTSAVK